MLFLQSNKICFIVVILLNLLLLLLLDGHHVILTALRARRWGNSISPGSIEEELSDLCGGYPISIKN